MARATTGLIVAHVGHSAAVLTAPAITPCPDLPSSTFMFLSSVGAPFLRPGPQSQRAPVATAVKGSAQPRGATRSRLFAESMASTGEHWTLRAVATGATIGQAGASELPLPLPTIPRARREAEAGSPSKRSIREASESEITLNSADRQ